MQTPGFPRAPRPKTRPRGPLLASRECSLTSFQHSPAIARPRARPRAPPRPTLIQSLSRFVSPYPQPTILGKTVSPPLATCPPLHRAPSSPATPQSVCLQSTAALPPGSPKGCRTRTASGSLLGTTGHAEAYSPEPGIRIRATLARCPSGLQGGQSPGSAPFAPSPFTHVRLCAPGALASGLSNPRGNYVVKTAALYPRVLSGVFSVSHSSF